MGMVLCLSSIDDDSISKLLADPPLIWKVLSPDDPDMYASARGSSTTGSWFSRLFAKKEEPLPPTVAEVGPAVEEIDLDKSWHGIHFLLTETAWEGQPPLNFLVLGGEEVGDIDVGYGTARAFKSSDVDEIVRALEPITQEVLEARFDGPRMMKLEIYPEIWDRDPADDPVLEYCIEYFDTLKDFLRRTSVSRLGMLVFIS